MCLRADSEAFNPGNVEKALLFIKSTKFGIMIA
jgi:hypothetical protein